MTIAICDMQFEDIEAQCVKFDPISINIHFEEKDLCKLLSYKITILDIVI
jgi:hypothetical protein